MSRFHHFIGFALLFGRSLAQESPESPRSTPQDVAGSFPGEIGMHHRVHAWTETRRDAAGHAQEVPHRVVEIANGMNYWDGGAWVPSDPRFEVTPDAFAAVRTSHRVWLRGNLNEEGAVTVMTPDGQVLRSTPVAIGLYDAASGESAIVGEIQDCEGVQVSDTEVCYENAFRGDGVVADVVYTMSQGTFEQDVVIRGRLDPTAYGFPAETTQIRIVTEFVDPPRPERTRRPLRVERDEQVRERMVSPDLIDETLAFGELTFWTGTAYTAAAGSRERGGVPVAKEWVRGERTFLVESAEYGSLAEEMELLPEVDPVADQAMRRVRRTSSDHYALMARVPRKGEAKAAIPRRMLTLADAGAGKGRGIVIDYSAALTPSTSVLCGDTTYYVSGPVSLGAVTIEGGTVVKHAENTFIQLMSTVTCKTSSYRPAICTAETDGSVGEPVPGKATSVPDRFAYANPALYTYFLSAPTLSNISIRYAKVGIQVFGSSGFSATIANVQLVNCIKGISIVGCGSGGCTASVTVNNALFSRVNQPLHVSVPFATYCYLNNCTVDNKGWTDVDPCYMVTRSGGTASVQFKNSVFTNVSTLSYGSPTLTGDHNGFATTSLRFGTFQSVSAVPFQTRGGGKYYLAAGSIFKDGGTTAGLPSALLNDLKLRTTEPPMALTVSGDTSLWRTTRRDTDTPDLGYHYGALDYTLANVSLAATLNLHNGVALGLSGECGLNVQPNGHVNSEGTPLQMNCVASLANVQEEPFGNGGNLFLSLAEGSVPRLDFRFSEFSVGQGKLGTLLDTSASLERLTFRDSVLCNAKVSVAPASAPATVSLVNNLLDRCHVSLTRGSVSSFAASFYNNLFIRTPLSDTSLRALKLNAGTTGTIWDVADNVFDGATQELVPAYNIVPAPSINRSCNGFMGSTQNSLPCNIVGRQDRTQVAVSYQTGALGGYYIPTTATSLIDAGSQSAADAGLYHYTTTTDNVKEQNGIVDIGFHYVAVEYGQRGLVGFWRMDESTGTTAKDCSGNGRDGTLYGAATWSAYGRRGGALNLDGLDDCARVVSTLVLTTDSQFSYAAWFKWTGGGGGSDGRKFILESTGSGNPYVLSACVNGSGKIQVYSSLSSGTTPNLIGATTIWPNQWYHLAVTWDRTGGANNLKLYLNGVVDGQVTTLLGYPVATTGLMIGTYRGANDRWFRGLVDDVRVFNRALGIDEVAVVRDSLNPNTVLADDDRDGAPDCSEDANGDGIFQSGSERSSYLVVDTDGDGVADGLEVSLGRSSLQREANWIWLSPSPN